MAAALGCAVLFALLHRPLPGRPPPDNAIEALFYLGVGVGLALGAVAYRQRTRRIIRSILNERGVPICIACGYDLTGTVSGVCPECGAAVRNAGVEA